MRITLGIKNRLVLLVATMLLFMGSTVVFFCR
jgi:hypothetical protein